MTNKGFNILLAVIVLIILLLGIYAVIEHADTKDRTHSIRIINKDFTHCGGGLFDSGRPCYKIYFIRYDDQGNKLIHERMRKDIVSVTQYDYERIAVDSLMTYLQFKELIRR